MQLGLIGLGRMGSGMTLRLLQGGHQVMVYDRVPEAGAALAGKGATVSGSLEDLGQKLKAPRVVWLMIPAGPPVDDAIQRLSGTLSPGDIIIDGGNSNYKDSIRRAETLRSQQIEFLDVGVSGGIWGLKVGFNLMAGGNQASFKQVEPIFQTLAPPDGYAYVGPSGAGHYAKMVHNGIEYGMMQAYGEGLEILRAKQEFNYDLAAVTEAWRYGTVIRSWLLDLAAESLKADPDLKSLEGYVADSGEGRWTVQEALDLDVPAPVITASIFHRYYSRGNGTFASKVLAAMRNQFGGHAVKKD